MSELTVEGRAVAVTNEDRVLFPEAGITKGELVDYYRRIAERMLPHVKGRPVVMQRFPRGIHEGGFVQQQIPDYFPEWIERVTVPKETGGEITHVLINNAATLVYLANQGCITPHVWLSRQETLRRPDRLIFDLDPPDGDFELVRRTAMRFRRLLTQRELAPFVMTTGSRGLHVTVPLVPEAAFDEVRGLARALAEELAAGYPGELTVEQRKDKRAGRLFLDTLRNAYGQTAVPPYAVRPLPGAPVATPLDWPELDNPDLNARSYTIENVFRRLGQKDDPWQDINAHTARVG